MIRRARSFGPAALAWISCVILVVLAVAFDPGLASLSSLRAQLSFGAIIGIVALGQTMVVIGGQIDLSIPWTLTLSAMVMAALSGAGAPQSIAIAGALVIGLAVGVVNAIGVGFFRVQALVWTLAMNLLLQGATLGWTNSQPPRGGIPPIASALAIGSVAGLPPAALLWLVLGGAAVIALGRSSFGRLLYATGMNPLATLESGIDIRRTWAASFLISGLSASIGGILLAGYTSQVYLGMGNDYLLLPIAAVVLGGSSILGGTGGYIGTVAGVFIVLVLQTTLSIAQVSQASREVLFGAIVLAMVTIYARRDAAE